MNRCTISNRSVILNYFCLALTTTKLLIHAIIKVIRHDLAIT